MKKKVFYGWWIVIATNIICMLGFGTWLYSFGVFFKPMMAEFGWSRAQTAGAASLRSIEGGVAGPLVGFLVDRYGGRWIIFTGGVISGLGFAAMFFVNSLVGFYLFYGLFLSVGMSFMLYIPSYTVIAKWFQRKLSRALSILAVGAGLGGLIFTPISSILIQHLGWRFAFLAIGIVVWLIVLPLSMVIREKPSVMGLLPDGDAEKAPDGTESGSKPVEQGRDFTLKEAMLSSSFWLLSVAMFCQSMAHSVVFVHAVPHLTDIGFSAPQAAFSVGLITMVSVVGRLSFGYLGDFIDKRRLFTVSYAMIGLGVVVLRMADTMPLVYLFIALFGIGYGANVPLMPAIRAQYFGRASLGKIQGFMTPVTMVAGATGPITAGYLFDQSGSYSFSFLIISVLPFLAAVLVSFLPPAGRVHGIA